MLKRICLFLLILFLLTFFAIIHGEPVDFEIKSSVNKNKVALNETFYYRIDVSGNITKIPEIKLPDFNKNFNVISTGQSQQISFKGKKTQMTISYEFILQPKQTGKITIEEAEVKFQGKLYKTEALDIEVTTPKEFESLPDEPKKKPQPPAGGIFI